VKTKRMRSSVSAARNLVALAVLFELAILFAPSAWAVPSFSRRYGVTCSTCHTMWGALNGAGQTFKLSGYRAMNGKDMKPVSEDIELAKDVAIPTTLPLSFVTGVGYDYRKEKRTADNGSTNTATGSSLALEDASIFMTSPLGPHWSAFVEFPMYETKSWEFTPTGPAEANKDVPKHIRFTSEKPTFEVAKFFWNNLAGDAAPRDLLNLAIGITHPPLAFSPGKVRLDVNQYLVYERRALDLISKKPLDEMIGSENADNLFRVSEPQVLAELFGMTTFGKPVTDVSKADTLWAEYHLGVTNGSNAVADNNTQKDIYGRYVMRYRGQSAGLFGYYSRDTYDDGLRTQASIVNGGIMSGAQSENSHSRLGLDLWLSLAPWGVPLTLQNQVMFMRESNPTGFNKAFSWKGGSNELIYQASRDTVMYTRYDWVRGDNFNDTNSLVNGISGITNTTPTEWDVVAGWQHLVNQNTKLVAEFRHHKYQDQITGASLKDDGVQVKFLIGF
jgi:hypothetical protein